MKGGFSITQNQIAYNNLLETKRHQLATEAETNRNHLEMESQGRANIAETIRSHQANEVLTRAQIMQSGLNARMAADATRYAAATSANAVITSARISAAQRESQSKREVAASLATNALNSLTTRATTAQKNATSIKTTSMNNATSIATNKATNRTNLLVAGINTAGKVISSQIMGISNVGSTILRSYGGTK